MNTARRRVDALTATILQLQAQQIDLMAARADASRELREATYKRGAHAVRVERASLSVTEIELACVVESLAIATARRELARRVVRRNGGKV